MLALIRRKSCSSYINFRHGRPQNRENYQGQRERLHKENTSILKKKKSPNMYAPNK